MKYILQILVLFIFFYSDVHANDYSRVETVKLKKDEHKKFLVQYGTVKKLFKFRWTLYANDGLVVLRSYDRIVAQNVLYLKLKNSTFKLDLKPKNGFTSPYLLVKFMEFDYTNNEAVFKLFLSDKNAQVTFQELEES